MSWGSPALDLPLLRYETLDPPAPAGRWDWVLLTSPQGARAYAAWAGRPDGAKIGTLGDGTRAALEAVGLFDELGCNVADGAALARAFVASVTAPCRVLLPGAVSRLSEPAKTLRAAGYEVLDVPLYRTSAVPPEQLPPAPLAAGDMVFFCSPTAVRAFAAAWKERPDCVAIGATTAAVAREAGFAAGGRRDPRPGRDAAGRRPGAVTAEHTLTGVHAMDMYERPRRLRVSPVMREMVAETSVEARHLITPHFVVEGTGLQGRDRQHARHRPRARWTNW